MISNLAQKKFHISNFYVINLLISKTIYNASFLQPFYHHDKFIMMINGQMKSVFAGLSLFDKLLPLLILLAMILGILLSVYVPNSRTALNQSTIINVSIPLAVGLIIMMVPPLTKVEWENCPKYFNKNWYLKPILFSLVLNWILCPLLMFGLAWLTLFDLPQYRTGIIMIGLARCIAMVLLWNDLAQGDNNLCAIIVLINSLLQVVLYAPYQVFFCYIITGDPIQHQSVYLEVAKSVGFFLGIPLGLGIIIRFIFLYFVGRTKFESKYLPFISPWALIALLYTIIVIFMEKGNDFVKEIGSGLRCFVPLVLYFVITWFGTFFGLRYLSRFNIFTKPKPNFNSSNDKLDLFKQGNHLYPSYPEITTQAFTAASNNFELSLAIAISIYGSGSKQAIAAVFGPLLEVPILLVLTFLSRYFRIRLTWYDIDTNGNDIVFEVDPTETLS